MGYVEFCYRVVQNYDNFEGLILVTETKISFEFSSNLLALEF